MLVRGKDTMRARPRGAVQRPRRRAQLLALVVLTGLVVSSLSLLAETPGQTGHGSTDSDRIPVAAVVTTSASAPPPSTGSPIPTLPPSTGERTTLPAPSPTPEPSPAATVSPTAPPHPIVPPRPSPVASPEAVSPPAEPLPSPTSSPDIHSPGPAAGLPLAPCRDLSASQRDPALETLVLETLGDDAQRYAVVVHNLTTGTAALVQPERVFYAASLYKLAVLYQVYRQERAGTVRFSQTLTITEEVATQDLGTLDLLGWSVGTEVTVAQAVEAMITLSDNTSAVLLARLVGWHNIDRSLDEIGIRTWRVNEPELPVTAADVARLLSAMACGQLVDAEASREMLSLLAAQRIRDRIPAGVPAGVTVANKTGNWIDATHDAAIVYAPSNTYVLVVLSETSWQSEPIVRLSAAVYRYFEADTGAAGDEERSGSRPVGIALQQSRQFQP